MLAQEIQGRKHAFLAGNLTYYVGGQYHCWRHHEDEIIGLTHPFHHDLRGRGFGLAKHPESRFGHGHRSPDDIHIVDSKRARDTTNSHTPNTETWTPKPLSSWPVYRHDTARSGYASNPSGRSMEAS
jgi:hypothetical protein